MEYKKVAAAGTVLLAATLTLAACGNKSASESPAKTKTWSRMVKDVIQTQDDARIVDVISGQTAVDTMEGLYRYTGSELKPGLATSVVKPTDNGLTYTYKLRKSTWSNGDKLTAKDFVYSWQRAVDPKTKSEYGYLFSGIKNADKIMAGKEKPANLGIKAVDDYTLQVTLEHAIPYFNTMMVNPVFFPTNKAAVDKYGKNYGSQSKYIVNNGPYTLKGWNGTNNSWSEVKNNKYWNAKDVHIKTIKTQVVKDSTTALNLYNSHKLDDAVLAGATAQKNRTNKDYSGLKQGRTTYLDMNEKKVPAFKNAKLRQAISMAIDRKQFVDKVLGDGSIVAQNLSPEGMSKNPATGKDFAKEAAASAAGDTSSYNLTQAKKLWSQGLKEAGKSSLDLTLLTDDTEQAKQSGEYLQSALEKLPGLKVTMSAVPFKTRIARSLSGDTQLVLSSWQGDYPDPITFLDLYTTGNTYNFGFWSNSKYDALIKASKTTDATNDTKRYDDLQQAQQLLTQQAGMVPLYQTVEAHLVNPSIKGLTYSPANMYNFVGASLK
ncbi:peptide ABC transporter substrate-binding protein [Lacticaseibacillus jixiensis]|uniref:peptide ABC transporter substrate-binding protein n=1 Tax=Lacticaseibacillus jixiensis TaxID=3231926 RepID=UPI0036F29B0F